MKHGFRLGMVLAGLLMTVIPSSPGTVERVFMFGTEYVRMDDWARANRYTFRWTVPKQEARIIMPGGSLVFRADSRKIGLKGIQVALAAPVVMKNGAAYLSAVDLNGTVNPILFPSRIPAARPVKTIVLDPGHGGKDPGNQEGRRQEKEYTLTLARELSALLTKAGFNVFLTRTSDTFLDLPERAEIARRRGADLLLCLHFNSFDGVAASSVQGAETFCMTQARTSSTHAQGQGAQSGAYPGNRSDAKNVLLSYQIQKALVLQAGLEDRGVKRARFAVLRDAQMPTAYIEAAFMTHPGDARRIYDAAQRRRLAEAVVEGVRAYKKLVDR